MLLLIATDKIIAGQLLSKKIIPLRCSFCQIGVIQKEVPLIHRYHLYGFESWDFFDSLKNCRY